MRRVTSLAVIFMAMGVALVLTPTVLADLIPLPPGTQEPANRELILYIRHDLAEPNGPIPVQVGGNNWLIDFPASNAAGAVRGGVSTLAIGTNERGGVLGPPVLDLVMSQGPFGPVFDLTEPWETQLSGNNQNVVLANSASTTTFLTEFAVGGELKDIPGVRLAAGMTSADIFDPDPAIWAVDFPSTGYFTHFTGHGIQQFAAVIDVLSFPQSLWDNQDGAGDFNWATAANWNPDNVPDVAANVVISNGDTVLLSAVSEANTVLVGNGGLVIDSDGQLSVVVNTIVAANGTLSVGGILNASQVTVQGAMNVMPNGQAIATADIDIQAGSTLNVNGSVTAATVHTGGTLSGRGTIRSPITVADGGIVSPGDGIGVLTTRSIVFQDGASLEIELTGSESDQLNVTGELNLSSTSDFLSLKWVPSDSGSRFGGDYIVAPYDTRVSIFDTIGGGSDPYSIGQGYVKGVDYFSGRVAVSLHPLLDGDTDVDGDVDQNDGLKMIGNLGTASGMEWTDGDVDFDWDVDLNDGMVMVTNLGAIAGDELALAGAEPGGLGDLAWAEYDSAGNIFLEISELAVYQIYVGDASGNEITGSDILSKDSAEPAWSGIGATQDWVDGQNVENFGELSIDNTITKPEYDTLVNVDISELSSNVQLWLEYNTVGGTPIRAVMSSRFLLWNNHSGDSNWATAANWSPDLVPDIDSSTIIANGDAVRLHSTGQEAKKVDIQDGTLQITNLGQLTVTERVSIWSDGTLRVDGTLTATQVNCTGTLTGRGTITSPITVADSGIVSPGDGIGVLSTGSIVFQEGASLEIELTGSESDQLNVTGELSLTSTSDFLPLTWVPSDSGSKFDGDYIVASFDTRVGIFDSVGGGSDPYSIGQRYVKGVDYFSGRVTVSLHPLLSGDADLNGRVDFGDYMILEAAFGAPGEWKNGDFDLDGDIDFGDYMILEAAFGDRAGVEEAAAVPEPSTLILLIIGAVGLLAYGWRRRT